jgi:DNA-binding transcriptional LysR family regulator
MPNLYQLSPQLLDLDGRQLRIFLMVLETGSLTAAAEQLGVTQSAISHTVDKLRLALGDPLFVKAGRGIVPTSRAQALAEPARRLLDDLRQFSIGPDFVPQDTELVLTVAANDFQRDLLLPAFQRRLAAQVKDFRLVVIPSLAPTAEVLRERRCDLIVTPRPPVGSDIFQKRLLTDAFVCFFDPACRAGPVSLDEYLEARHVIAYQDGRRLEFDASLEAQGIERRIGVAVPNFSGVAAFLSGTPMLASLPGLLHKGAMRGFGVAPVPLLKHELPMYMVWHRHHHDDPLFRWVRRELEQVSLEVMGAVAAPESNTG